MFGTSRQVVSFAHCFFSCVVQLSVIFLHSQGFAQVVKIEETRESSSAQPYIFAKGKQADVEREALARCKKINPVFTDVAIDSEALNLLSANDFKIRCVVGAPSGTPGSIEKRILQTRRFQKSPREVSEAIRSFLQDLNSDSGGYPVGISLPIVSPVGATYFLEDDGNGNVIQKATVTGFHQTPGTYYLIHVLPFSRFQSIYYKFEILADLPKPKTGQKVTLSSDSFNSLIDVGTIVQLQLHISDAGKGHGAIYHPIAYERVFKSIANQLFVEAIELAPLEVQ